MYTLIGVLMAAALADLPHPLFDGKKLVPMPPAKYVQFEPLKPKQPAKKENPKQVTEVETRA